MKDDFETDINKEIITCLFDYLFILIKGSYNTNFLIRCSYLELFNEEIRNLLVKNYQQKLVLREVPETLFYVEDLNSWKLRTLKI